MANILQSALAKVKGLANQYIERVAKPMAVGTSQVRDFFNPTDQNRYVDTVFKAASNIPRYQLPQKLPGNFLPTDTSSKATNFLSGLGRSVIESPLNIPRNLLVGNARLQQEQLNLLRGRGYNLGNAVAGAGNLVEGGLDLATLGIGKNIVEGGARELLKTGAWNAIKQGAKQGAKYGAIGGASYGAGNQYGQRFNVGEVAVSTLGGAALGSVFGGGLAGIGTLLREIKYNPKLLEQLREANGRWKAGDKPVKPPGMPKAQFEFQVKVNNKLGRSPYEPIMPNDLKDAIDMGLSVRVKGGNKAILEAEKSAQAGLEPVITSKGGKIKLRIRPTEEVPQAEAIKRISLQTEKPVVSQSMQTSLESRSFAKVPSKTAPRSPIQEATLKQSRTPGTEALPDIISKGDIDVKSKVGIFDYLRTPDRVMKKIGLEKEMGLLRQQYDKYLKELPQEIERITEWSKEVPESGQRLFQYLDGKPVQLSKQELGVANKIKTYLATWADKLGLPEDKRITNYITHIFEKDFIKKEFDPDIAKLIQNRVAGSVYDPFVEQRLGKMGYVEDVWRSLDAYVKRATRKVNMDVALKEVKASAENLELSQYNYVKKYIDRINLRPTELDNLVDNTIKQLAGYKFGQRPITSITRKARQMVYRGTLGLNPGTALKNLTQGANTYAKLGERYTIKGYWDLLTKGTDELKEVGVLRDMFIQDRNISVGKQLMQKIDKGLFVFFDAAEKINRGSAYYGAKAMAIAKGASEQDAIQAGLKMVRDTQFTFGSIDTPPVLSSDIGKLLLQFQSFTIKQGEFLGEMIANKEFAGLIRYGLAGTAMVATIGKLIGMEPKDLIPTFRFGVPPTLQTPVEIGKALIGAPDKYGNIPDTKQRLKNVGRSLIPFIPGGTQGRKTLQGLEATGQGYSESESGRVRFPVPQDPISKLRGALFGQYNFAEGRRYYDEALSVLGEKQSEKFKKLIRESPERAIDYYESIIQGRKENKLKSEKEEKGTVLASEVMEEDAREILKDSDQPFVIAENRAFYETDAGGVASVSLDFEPETPKLTGEKELDDELAADYKSEISTIKNNAMKAFGLGAIDQKQALEVIKKMNSLKNALKKPKKLKIKQPKFVPLKFGKRKKISGLTKKKGMKLIRAPKLKEVKL